MSLESPPATKARKSTQKRPKSLTVFCSFQVSRVIASQAGALLASHGDCGETLDAIESSSVNGTLASATSGVSAREFSGPPAGTSPRLPSTYNTSLPWPEALAHCG